MTTKPGETAAPCFSIKKQAYQAALDDFNKAIGLFPGKGMYFLNRARCHFMLGHQGEAPADIAAAEKLGEPVPADFRKFVEEYGKGQTQ